MADIKHSELDFFKCKLLGDKEATCYIRDGEMFFYIGNDKLVLDSNNVITDEESEFIVGDTIIKSVKTDLSKESKTPGFFWFWQDESYYGLTFFDNKQKRDPIVLKIGDANKEI